jgi:hypothetical protein
MPQCNSLDPNGPPDPASCAPPPLVNPSFSSIRGMFYEGRSYYNSLELQLAKRMSHGFQLRGVFTFWNANCNPAPPSLGAAFNPVNPSLSNEPQLPPLACFNLRGRQGRNTLIGPGITALDFSVFKNNRITRISENFNVQFRVEMFNILNHPNFAPPGPGDGNTDIFDATGTSLAPSATNPGGTAGVLVRTTIPERQIQFALKVTF